MCGLIAAAAVLAFTADEVLAQPYFARTQVLAAPHANNDFATSVAVDGDWMAAGARRAAINGTEPAAVYVYRQAAGVWAPFQQIACPVSDTTLCRNFGNDVALSGSTLAISSSTAVGNPIATVVWIYGWNGSTWAYETELSGPPGWNVGDSLALDGDYLVASGVSSADRAAFVFERIGSVWNRIELVGADRAPNDWFGTFWVDISGDTVCVGAPGHSSSATIPGAVHVFRRTSGMWSQEGPRLQPLSTNAAHFGKACAVHGDTLVVSAPDVFTPGQPGSGRIFSFTRSGSTWSLTQTIVPDDDGTSTLGEALAIEGDGLVAGAPGHSTTPRGLLYARIGGTWVLRERAEVPIVTGGFRAFGDEVATDGRTLLVAGTKFFSAESGSIAVYRPSSTPPATPGAPPAPVGLTANVTGNTVALAWAPGVGAQTTGYTVLARMATGGPLVASLPVGGQTSFSVAAPNGTFVVSVRGSNAHGSGPESLPVTVNVPQTAPPPGPPSGLSATVVGNAVTFTWNAPAAGGAPAGYRLLAGTSPGFAVPIATMPMPASPRSFSVGNVPPGTYYARVVAANGGGIGGASNEISVAIAAPTAPGAPILSPASVSGHTVTLAWTPGPGGAPTGYVLTASAAPGGTPLVVAPVSRTGATFGGVPSGTYYVRIAAVNGVGTSPPSNEVAVVVP